MTSSALAQSQAAAPLVNPKEQDIVDALAGRAGGLQGKSFRRTADPDADSHACLKALAPTVAQKTSQRNLVVVPYAAEGAPTLNLVVNFASNSDRLLISSHEALTRLANALKSPQLEAAAVAVAGHTDAVGPLRTNLQLSCARAIAVRNYLLAKGVEPERLGAYGFGPTRPLEVAVAASAVNRRVEIRRAN
ncbi:MAG: OmpA family protein [Burkholderiaceae bacterium]